VDVMSDVKQAPKRRLRGVSVLAVGAVLVLLIVGVFALGQAVADQGGQATASSSQFDRTPGAGGYGPMMGWAQDDRGDGSWMRYHMDDVTWMRDHPAMRSWMRGHRDDMPWAGHDWNDWKDWGPHRPSGSGRSGYGAGGGYDRPHMMW
jgi:hypothetical protein